MGDRGSGSTRYSEGLVAMVARAAGNIVLYKGMQPVLTNTLQYSCLENRPDREAWEATVHRIAKSRDDPSDPACIDTRLFFTCGSSALVRVEHEGGTAAWPAGTPVAPSVQGYGLPLP